MATVKLLLKESIKNVGKVGDVVEVSPGYARNYLLPKDLAVQPTAGNIKKVEERRKEIERQEREKREQQAALIKQLEGVEVTLERRANEQGHLFGSVSATDIAKALQAQGFNIEAGDIKVWVAPDADSKAAMDAARKAAKDAEAAAEGENA